MNENEFRKRLSDALGEPPPLAAPVLSRPDAQAQHAYPRTMALLAAGLAILLVLVLVASRIALHPTSSVLPAAPPSGNKALAADSFPCALPAIATTESGNPGQDGVIHMDAGFVNIPGGSFQVDPTANVRGMPSSYSAGPTIYSATLQRWLPVGSRNVAPDGRSYAYVALLPAGATYSDFTSAELHVYDVDATVDHKVWSYPGSIDVLGWNSSGILAQTVPPQGGVGLFWRVDPSGRGASQGSSDEDPGRLPLSALPGGNVNYSYLGGDSTGRAVFRIGSRDPGVKYSVVVLESGNATTIYSGTQGDAKDFDPGGVYFDAHGLWMGNFDGSVVWLWSRSTGLTSFKLSGLPAMPSGYQYSNLTVGPAGPCIPGVFAGAQASAQPPAPTPTPSPPPPTVDWSALTVKPLHLNDLPSGSTCPVTPSVNLKVKAQTGKWPNYGFGKGPAYLSGQFTWYSAGAQGAVILVDPVYKGPVLVRSRRLDGKGALTFSGAGGDAVGNGAFGVPQTSAPPYWGTWAGSVALSTPGCYGIQFDGTSFSVVIVISVKQGPPPPG